MKSIQVAQYATGIAGVLLISLAGGEENDSTYSLETKIPISSDLSVKAFAELSPMASLMSSDSMQLPIKIALVFENECKDAVAFEVDAPSAVLTSSDNKEYRPTSFSVLLPNGGEHLEKGSSPVPFWIPAGIKSVAMMTFVPLRANSRLLLRCNIRGPMKGMRAVPANCSSKPLPPIRVLIDQLPHSSPLFRNYILGKGLFEE